MAAQDWGLVAQTDEEAHAVLTAGHEQHPRRGDWRVGLGLAGFLCVAATAWWAVSPQSQLIAALSPGLNFKVKVELPPAVEPREAWKRSNLRERLTVEGDLQTLLLRKTARKDGTPILPPDVTEGPETCHRQAEWLFDGLIGESSLSKELNSRELKAFKERFVSAMQHECKEVSDEKAWIGASARELERQKPVMTQALAESINEAKLGFRAEMRDWLLHESAERFQGHLGLLPTKGQPSILRRKSREQHEEDLYLPEAFQAEEKWPVCKEAILRIHNQGYCGSCWAFSATASMDARMCIASSGAFNGDKDVLSRLQTTSCASEMKFENANGCRGGLPHWAFEMMGQTGIVSSQCIPYYITGAGQDHFFHSGSSPPCALQNHCRGGYPMTMKEDAFMAPGVEAYDWITEVHGDAAKIFAMKTAIYEEGPVSFAFNANTEFMGYASGIFSVCSPESYANHAVYASGWGDLGGVPYIQASNSWGAEWGDAGRFLIHPDCVTDVVIAGTITDTELHPVGDVDSDVPDDASNPNWPWKPDEECPFEDRCITDLEKSGPYKRNEICVSDKLNGKALKVVEFDTERWYDILHVNGQAFSGSMSDVAGLDGLVVDENGIRFESDPVFPKSGFKLCAQ
jgi:hypothetical protein